MVILVLIGSFLILLLLGCSLGFAMGISTLLYMILFDGTALIMLAQRLTEGVYSFPLLAIPYFILAGVLMNHFGITDRIFTFARTLVGHITGGLGHVNVLASMMFAGMSGSALADAGGLGAVEIRAMREAGYSKRFSAAITASSSCIGPIIPPSIIMIVYAVLAEVSVADMFAGGIIPGILMGLTLMVTIYIMAKFNIETCPKDSKSTMKKVLKAFKGAILPLMTPMILVSGILFGVFTPTEGGAIAILYTIVVGIYYKTFTLKVLLNSMIETIKTSAQVLFFMASASAFLWVLTIEHVPSIIVNSLLSLSENKFIILFLLVIALMVIGMFMAIDAALILLVPVLLALAEALSLDLVHVGVFVIVALMIGLISPPVGPALFIVSSIAKIEYGELAKASLPFIIPLIVVVFLVAYIPALVTFLPSIIP
ncbi:TRAP transporter large permease [Virgibacillus oceani]